MILFKNESNWSYYYVKNKGTLWNKGKRQKKRKIDYLINENPTIPSINNCSTNQYSGSSEGPNNVDNNFIETEMNPIDCSFEFSPNIMSPVVETEFERETSIVNPVESAENQQSSINFSNSITLSGRERGVGNPAQPLPNNFNSSSRPYCKNCRSFLR